LILAFLAGCSPAAGLAQSATSINPGQSQPAAPASAGVNQPAVQGSAPAPTVQTVPSGMRTMTVTGTGQAALTPDMAFVTIGVQTEDSSISQAMTTNKAQTQKVIDVIKAQGVDPKDIQTTNFSVYPNQKMSPNGEAQGTTYMVSNNVYVTVRDLNKLGSMLDAVVQNGANTISGIQFDVSDKTAALSSARKDAVKNASDLANELASAAGVQLGQIASISVNSNSAPIPMGYGMGGGGALAAGSPVPVSAGQMIINVDVTVVYELK
jgi:uncharacterized protein YggE